MEQQQAAVALDFRVRYETDAMGVVYANYLVWLNSGALSGFAPTGSPTGNSRSTVSSCLPVHAPATTRIAAVYDDLVRIETTVTNFSRARVGFAYRVSRSSRGRNVAGRGAHGARFPQPRGSPAAA